MRLSQAGNVNILAVSDVPSRSLENVISKWPERLKNVDLVVSCGDLDSEYIEFVVDGLSRNLFFVSGNHTSSDDLHEYDEDNRFWNEVKTFPGRIMRHIAGSDDLHGRIEAFRGYVIVGFGGSNWYNGKGNQFTEKQMAKVVRQVKSKLRWYRLRHKLLFKTPGKVIVISHAPIFGVHDQPDVCHTGFRCFLSFIKSVKPLLWIHGHVHLTDENKNQVTLVDKTTVINASGYKFITIEPEQIQVSYKNQILDK